MVTVLLGMALVLLVGGCFLMMERQVQATRRVAAALEKRGIGIVPAELTTEDEAQSHFRRLSDRVRDGKEEDYRQAGRRAEAPEAEDADKPAA